MTFKGEVSLNTTEKLRETLQTKKETDYFVSVFSALSRWIANLGVVPWLRLCALRFCPDFVLFADFLIFVIRVFETITLLLCPHLSYLFSNRSLVLAINHTCVKVMFLILSQLVIFPIEASIKSIYLKKGEFYSLPSSNITSFSTGNIKVIKVKLIHKQNTLLVKAIKKGSSDLVLFSPKRQQILRFHVGISKQNTSYPNVLKTWLEYQQIKQRQKSPPVTTTINHPLKQVILNKIFVLLFQQGINDFQCENSGLQFFCFYDGSQPIHKSVRSYLESTIFIKLIPRNVNHNKNYQLSFRLVLLEANNSKSIRLGMQTILGDLKTLFNQGLSSLLNNHQQLLSKESLLISSLADEKIIIRAGKTNELSFGSKVSYQETVIQDQKTLMRRKWLFTGLKAKFKVFQEDGLLYLSYLNSFSRPIGPENMTTNRQKGTTHLVLNRAIKFFEISYLATRKQQEELPLLGRIPLIKYFFSARQTQQIHKKISGFLTIKEVSL